MSDASGKAASPGRTLSRVGDVAPAGLFRRVDLVDVPGDVCRGAGMAADADRSILEDPYFTSSSQPPRASLWVGAD